jgi:5-enolpyruvylshikimate-3-phosphate synthase
MLALGVEPVLGFLLASEGLNDLPESDARRMSGPPKIREGQDSQSQHRMYLMGCSASVFRGLLLRRSIRQRHLATKSYPGFVRGFANMNARRLIDPGKLESGL